MAEKEHVVQKDGHINTDNVDKALDKIPSQEMDDILRSFEEFRTYLEKRLDLAKNIGLNNEQLAKIGEKVADYLAEKVEPRNREEKLLQELWISGNEGERHMLAHLLVKLVDKSQ
ncbi:DUF3243 domain-containing protein [Peribacillus sp. SCS-155]|uniref:DUF3243 domain-containing protein n=1 Tax=Peribacillus sedimenti TaxID=3115297 RepID=UPI0039067403